MDLLAIVCIQTASLPSTSAFPSFTSISSLLDSQGADGSNVRISSMQGTFEERVLKSYANLSRHLQRASHTDVARDQNADGALGGLSRPTASATAILQTSPSERPSARDKKAIGFTPPSKLPSKMWVWLPLAFLRVTLMELVDVARFEGRHSFCVVSDARMNATLRMQILQTIVCLLQSLPKSTWNWSRISRKGWMISRSHCVLVVSDYRMSFQFCHRSYD